MVASTVRPRTRARRTPCFNPLHCGAVVASSAVGLSFGVNVDVSIPFIAGQWSLHAPETRQRRRKRVSIPFIAGQWSLLLEVRGVAYAAYLEFQSPSLRGSGRFGGARRRKRRRGRRFQSPSLRGSGRFKSKKPVRMPRRFSFQSPSLRGSGRFYRQRRIRHPPVAGFNPLHCGAVVASRPPEPGVAGPGAGFNPLHCGAVVASNPVLP